MLTRVTLCSVSLLLSVFSSSCDRRESEAQDSTNQEKALLSQDLWELDVAADAAREQKVDATDPKVNPPSRNVGGCEWKVSTSDPDQVSHVGRCDSGTYLVSGGCKATNTGSSAPPSLVHSYAMERNQTDLEDGDNHSRGNRWRCTYSDVSTIKITMLCCDSI